MMNQPLVSVIIPTYNRETYLRQALQSVVDQTYKNVEIIVVDDGSKYTYAKAICDDFSNTKYFFKKNGGVSSARNYGILISKGKYIAFLDDDDYWRSDKLEKQVQLLEQYPNIGLIHSAVAVVDENGIPNGEILGASPQKKHKRSGKVFWNALGVWLAKSPTPLIRRSTLTADLLFDETIKAGEDFDFYQRYFYRHTVIYIEETLAFYRVYNDPKRLSVQKEKYVGIQYKMLQNLKKMGIKNPWTLYRISLKLLYAAKRNFKLIHSDTYKTISVLDFYLRPVYCLKNYFKVQNYESGDKS